MKTNLSKKQEQRRATKFKAYFLKRSNSIILLSTSSRCIKEKRTHKLSVSRIK